MCGIAGTVGTPPDGALLERMAQAMVNRGPDGQGTWADETAGLACRRLMIIDLHERSNQPLHLGPLHLVFNGEVYNYKELRAELAGLGHSFVTEGDGEVLLHAWDEWGERALERVNGMFALAFWDDRERSLTLASDPFGEKPLYYAQADGKLIFASDIKAILQDERVTARADLAALETFIARGAMPAPADSFFAGIRRLPGAHVLRWRDGRVEVDRYWQPARVDVPGSYGEATAALRELLLDSVRLRLRSDVPVGTSLSGGIDSSTVVLLSAELAGDHRRHAFTARFPGYERDEWQYAEAVGRAAGVVEHHAVAPTADEALADLERLVADQEEPVGSLSIYAQWRVMAEAKQAGVVVLLDGQGGDELFGGYPSSAGYALRSEGTAGLRQLATQPSKAAAVGRSLAADYLPGPLKRAYWRRISTRYASRDVVARAASRSREQEPWVRAQGPLPRELLTQSFDTSLPQLLRYADRSSMAWSRELRLPFLDRRVAELAFSLPAEFVYRNGTSKHILRDVGRGLVPESVLARTDKVGFEPPQRRWLNEPGFTELIGDVLLDPVARRRGLYDTSAVESDLRGGAWRDPAGIWRALNAELWLRALVEAPPPVPQPA